MAEITARNGKKERKRKVDQGQQLKIEEANKGFGVFWVLDLVCFDDAVCL
jgi:hypothetical protein